jgi:hypothetical protein
MCDKMKMKNSSVQVLKMETDHRRYRGVTLAMSDLLLRLVSAEEYNGVKQMCKGKTREEWARVVQKQEDEVKGPYSA